MLDNEIKEKVLQTQRKINELETLIENAFKDFCK